MPNKGESAVAGPLESFVTVPGARSSESTLAFPLGTKKLVKMSCDLGVGQCTLWDVVGVSFSRGVLRAGLEGRG